MDRMTEQLSPVERDCPPGWTPEKTAILEMREPYGRHLVGWYVHRDGCGCKMIFGMRMDRMETTFGIDPCADHRAAAAEALSKLRMMPGQDTPIVVLAADVFEAKIRKLACPS